MTAERYTLAELLLAIKQAGTDGHLNIDQVLRLFEAHPEYLTAALRAAGHAPEPRPRVTPRHGLPADVVAKAVQPLPPDFGDSAVHSDGGVQLRPDWADVELFHDRLQAEAEADAPAFLAPPATGQIEAPTVAMPRPVWRPPHSAGVDLAAIAETLRTGSVPAQTPREREHPDA